MNDEYVKFNSIVREQELEPPQEKEQRSESSRSSESSMSTSIGSDEETAESRRIMDGTPRGNVVLRTRQICPPQGMMTMI